MKEGKTISNVFHLDSREFKDICCRGVWKLSRSIFLCLIIFVYIVLAFLETLNVLLLNLLIPTCFLGGVRPWALVSGGWDNSVGVLG